MIAFDHLMSRGGAVWKLVGLITRRSLVQIQPPQFFTLITQDNYHAQIAQLVEQRTENPRVTGSIPVLGIFSYLFLYEKWSISSVGRALDF